MKKILIVIFVFFSFISYSYAEYELDIDNYSYTWTIKDKQLINKTVSQIWKNDNILYKLESLKTSDKFNKLSNRYKFIISEIITNYKIKHKSLNNITFWEWDDSINIKNAFISRVGYIWNTWFKNTKSSEYSLTLVYTWTWLYDFVFYDDFWKEKYIIQNQEKNYFYDNKNNEKIIMLNIPYDIKNGSLLIKRAYTENALDYIFKEEVSKWKDIIKLNFNDYFIQNIGRVSELYESYKWSLSQKICDWKETKWKSDSIEQCLLIKINSTYNQAMEWMPNWLFKEIRINWWYELQISNSTYWNMYCKINNTLKSKECFWVDDEVWEITTYYFD